ncbi:MAG TPA: hypothetical protein VED18_09490 [Candidatus Sulfotelmatobacter sp.]|nr:hypothetical protein [Candidatus Sulfotelmatobacter sp.]
MQRFGRSMLWTLAILVALTAWGGTRPAHATLASYEIIFHPATGPAPTGFITVNVTCHLCALPAGSVTFFDVNVPGLSGSPEWTLTDPRVFLDVLVGAINVVGINYTVGHDTTSPPAVPTGDFLTLTGPIDTYSIFPSGPGLPLGLGTYTLLPVPEAPLGTASMALAALAAAWLASRRRGRALAG